MQLQHLWRWPNKTNSKVDICRCIGDTFWGSSSFREAEKCFASQFIPTSVRRVFERSIVMEYDAFTCWSKLLPLPWLLPCCEIVDPLDSSFSIFNLPDHGSRGQDLPSLLGKKISREASHSMSCEGFSPFPIISWSFPFSLFNCFRYFQILKTFSLGCREIEPQTFGDGRETLAQEQVQDQQQSSSIQYPGLSNGRWTPMGCVPKDAERYWKDWENWENWENWAQNSLAGVATEPVPITDAAPVTSAAPWLMKVDGGSLYGSWSTNPHFFWHTKFHWNFTLLVFNLQTRTKNGELKAEELKDLEMNDRGIRWWRNAPILKAVEVQMGTGMPISTTYPMEPMGAVAYTDAGYGMAGAHLLQWICQL